MDIVFPPQSQSSQPPNLPPPPSMIQNAGLRLSPVPLGPPPPPSSLLANISTTTSSILPLKLEKPIYSSPPPAPSNPENNTCKMIEYRGAKVAAFNVDGRELICLPQAFELFLKHLVGGLHTVYTKLKRLDIAPVVCNVEQVRVLRGLGAIQPGVNRCKLIAPKEFDVLYDDCTNSSARPGRPPKRSPMMMAAHPDLEKLKKARMDNADFPYSPNRLLDPKKSPLFGNGYHYPPHLASMPFMPLGHPMMTMAMANHMASMRPDGSIIRDRQALEELHAQRAKEEQLRYEENYQHLENNNNHKSNGDKPLNLQTERSLDRHNTDRESCHSSQSDTLANGQLDLSMKSADQSGADDLDNEDDISDIDDNDLEDEGSEDAAGHSDEPSVEKPGQGTFSTPVMTAEASSISSVETLLMNIQGLLKVAAEDARRRERQATFEKTELKVELIREREMRETLEKQLVDEQRNRVMLQRRLKKEKRFRRKLQDQAEGSVCRVNGGGSLSSDELQYNSKPSDNYNSSGSSKLDEGENDRERPQSEPPLEERRLPDAHSGLQNLMESFLGSQKSCSTTSSNSNANNYLLPPVIQPTEAV